MGFHVAQMGPTRSATTLKSGNGDSYFEPLSITFYEKRMKGIDLNSDGWVRGNFTVFGRLYTQNREIQMFILNWICDLFYWFNNLVISELHY